MISDNVIFGHLKQVWNKETSFFQSNADDIAGTANGRIRPRNLSSTLTYMESVKVGPSRVPRPSSIFPRPTADLLRIVWSDLYQATQARDEAALQNKAERIAVIVNAFILPISGIEITPAGELPKAKTSRVYKSGVCSNAETYFNLARQQILKDQKGAQPAISVYHSESGTPLFLRKSYEASTALSLAAFDLGGISVPTGTIVRLAPRMTAEKRLTGIYSSDNNSFETYRVDDADFSPLRLSAWAWQTVEDISLYSIQVDNNGIGLDSARCSMLTTTTIEDFREAAHQLMDMCGVEH